MNIQGFKPAEEKNYSTVMYSQHVVPRSLLTDEQNFKYYDQYKKLLFTGYCIDKQVEEFRSIKRILESKMNTLEVIQQIMKKNFLGLSHVEHPPESMNSSEAIKPKRHRRTNQQIQRNFVCQFEKCDKAYASEGSLQQHIRLKHETKSSEGQSDQDKGGAEN